MNKIWKPLMCASLLGAACSLPAQAHGPYTDDYSSRSTQQQSVYMDSDTTAMWNTGTSRDPMGLPNHGAWGTGSMVVEQAMNTPTESQGGYRSAPATQQRSYAPAPSTSQPGWSDDYRMRGY